MTKHPTSAGQGAHVVTSVVPDTCWPDGSPVSNWSKATQTIPGKREPASAEPTFSPARAA